VGGHSEARNLTVPLAIATAFPPAVCLHRFSKGVSFRKTQKHYLGISVFLLASLL
jgi:hypothetical protein